MDTLSLGSAGAAVHDVQRRLAELGHGDLAVDGVLGPATVAATRRFQRDRGLPADGVVGPETWRALVDAGWSLGDRLLHLTRPPMRGDDVLDLQRRLSRLGFDTGPTDGILGDLTDAALRDFQLNVGLAVDGIAGAGTLRRLQALHREHQSATTFEVVERDDLRRRSQNVTGARILLDAAHGPADPGWDVDGLVEHEVVFDVARRAAGLLSALGAQPILSRARSATPDGETRASWANRSDVEAVVSLALTGQDGQPAATGVAGYFFGVERIVSGRGERLARLLLDAVVAETGAVDCHVHRSGASILRDTRAPAVLLELGFVTNPRDRAALRDPAHRGRLARAVADGLAAWLRAGR